MNRYCLHGVNPDILKTMLRFKKSSVIYFDDGLASVYKYRKELLKTQEFKKFTFNVPIIPYFIEHANFTIIDQEYCTCLEANKNALNNNFKNYMSQEMIDELFCLGFDISLHSYDHFMFGISLENQLKWLMDYVEENEELFPNKDKNGIEFIWPYNKKNDDFLKEYNNFQYKSDLPLRFLRHDIRIDGEWNSYFKKTQ